MNSNSVNAAMRHVYTALGAGVAVAVALGLLGQADADRVIALTKTIGESLGVIIAALAALLPIINAARAAWSATPQQQIAKVEALPNVSVVPLTQKGADEIKAATGIDKVVDPGAVAVAVTPASVVQPPPPPPPDNGGVYQ